MLGQLGRHRAGSAPRACSGSAAVGGKDRYLPSRLIDRFTTRLPTLEHHVLPDSGHSPHDDCPKQTYALLSPFLQESE
jgi:pimeloyl-ACP methyl ester carboxylesterase